MKGNERKRNKRVKKLVFICTLFAIVIMAATYAWFIGMKTVNVSSFDISIATTEGLFLSMDGKDWSYTLDARNATPYAKHTNVWAEDGLIPMSSIGDMDKTSSTMKLFEKGSLTATPGGYRLLSSRVHNFDKKDANENYVEGKGYVAFDLFIKNLSGTEYYATNEPLNEEAIYLNTVSSVTVSKNGATEDEKGIEGTGIENSVRVAFAQIGRVKGTTTNDALITGITCSDSGTGDDKVTGICRDAQIWEPNDTAHVQNAFNWFDTSCLKRKTGGSDVNADASYEEDACESLTLTSAYPTYAVSREITVDDNVNVYDGFNGYTTNTTDYKSYKAADDTTKAAMKLVNYDYFTDTEKNIAGAARPTFMTLAPNSITKVRVYIWLEGQDIDNYDFASLGRKIKINFGFTKERYTENDISYSGPSTDITPSPSDEAAMKTNGTHPGNPTPAAGA